MKLCYSALIAPLVPAEKLSRNLTICFSSGTVVPPDVTKTTGPFCLHTNSLTFSILSSKNPACRTVAKNVSSDSIRRPIKRAANCLHCMEQQGAFEGATQYTADSIERCQQLAQFIKKRLAIEEEYAKSLSIGREGRD
jgi:hypothetical protein